jgi:hypothetical protein
MIIMTERALMERVFDVPVMPVPFGIRAGCGFCLRFLPERGSTLGEVWRKSEDDGMYRKVAINAAHGVGDGESGIFLRKQGTD